MGKSWHIIKEFKAEANTILCVCGWFGDAGNADQFSDWFQHRRDNKDDPAPKGFDKRKFAYAPGNKLS